MAVVAKVSAGRTTGGVPAQRAGTSQINASVQPMQQRLDFLRTGFT